MTRGTCRSASHWALAGLVSAALAGPAAAQGGPVRVENAWARATPPGASVGAVYMSLVSPAGDRLLSVSSPVAQRAGLHTMTMDGTVMRMRALPDGLDLPAGKTVTLSPGGDHVMLEGLKAPLKRGGGVPLHLVFQKAPPMDVTAAIGAMGAQGPAGMAGMTMGK